MKECCSRWARMIGSQDEPMNMYKHQQDPGNSPAEILFLEDSMLW